VRWLDDPQARHEPGSPNITGVIGVATAMDTLMLAGMDVVEDSEQILLEFAIAALASVPGLKIYRMWEGASAVGAITFNIPGIPYALLASILSCEYGIDTRDGCFCAHPLMAHLLGLTAAQARAMGNNRRNGGIILGGVRVSLGLDTTYGSIMILADALRTIVKSGPRWSYQLTPDTSGCSPDLDLRGSPFSPPWVR
jgi:selenocysteine lyase/cysteine desulfurase